MRPLGRYMYANEKKEKDKIKEDKGRRKRRMKNEQMRIKGVGR